VRALAGVIVDADVGRAADHGASLSTTVTVKEQVAVPPPAVTTKVLVVTPTGKLAPLAKPAVWLVDAPGQLSVPTGAA
jgi:hypothetical protein